LLKPCGDNECIEEQWKHTAWQAAEQQQQPFDVGMFVVEDRKQGVPKPEVVLAFDASLSLWCQRPFGISWRSMASHADIHVRYMCRSLRGSAAPVSLKQHMPGDQLTAREEVGTHRLDPNLINRIFEHAPNSTVD
jgi:hypothetical protein